ncbi:hypothetical protein ACP275_07G062200 [Erythranthe tilingii]
MSVFSRINYLIPTSKIPVTVHCESGNDDLGNHTLPKLNNEFNWSFCESIFHNTLFFCRIQWGSKYLKFDVYKSEWRDRCSTRVCLWRGFKMTVSISEMVWVVTWRNRIAVNVCCMYMISCILYRFDILILISIINIINFIFKFVW